MRLPALLVALLMLSACGHFFEPSAHHEAYRAQQKQLAAAANNVNGKICKRMLVTGSNMPQRVCSTQEEWAAYDKKNRQDSEVLDQDRRNSGVGTDNENARPEL